MPSRFRTLLLEALRYFSEFGYTDETELQSWLIRLRYALERELPSDEQARKELAATLQAVFKRDVDRGGVQRRVPGISKYAIDRVAPTLRAELNRRIFAGVDLIRLNKAAATQKTIQRFSGWVTSVPKGARMPSSTVRATAAEVLKPTAQLKFERRRVAIDQGHKLSAAVAHVVAHGQGAIAGIWHDRGQYDHGYDARPEHLARSGKLFLVRDSWAFTEGLIKKGGLTYIDEIEQPAFLPFCSCWYEYVTTPRDVPAELLTAKGRAWVEGRAWVAGAGPRADMITRSYVDLAALNVARDPTAAQLASGNYRKGHVRVQGFDIAIETPRNALRTGVGADGQTWSVSMPAHYGYFKRTEGADGDELDCYIGPDPDAPIVWVVEQRDLQTGEFDEHKVMLGFGSRSEALKAYELGFSDGMGPMRCGNVLEMTVDAFKDWSAVVA